jgi:hypothetical protein
LICHLLDTVGASNAEAAASELEAFAKCDRGRKQSPIVNA